jgi:DNA helicase HerA-like ATPase
LIKENLFAVALFFYVYTNPYESFEQAVNEILARRRAAKIEANLTYFVKCTEVKDPIIVFNPEFFPFWEEVKKYYGIALANDCAGFNCDKEVASVLRKMFITALELPKEIEVKEEIITPEQKAVSIMKPRSIFLGTVVKSVVRRHGSNQKVFFPLDLLVKHALIIGSTGKGKTWFAMFLALQAAEQGVEVVIIDPHGTFKLLGQHRNLNVVFVKSSEEVVELLRTIYEEALKQPIQKEPELKKLIIIDELSAGKLGRGVKEIMRIVNACFSELRKFGYGMILIAQYATENRAISTNVRENAETYFIFRKKTMGELERIKTLKHPSLDVIPFLPERYCMVYSEDYYPEPFFISVPKLRF